jgi:alpha-mannosidase
MWEMPASRWAVVADDNESEGLFIVTESKFGFSCRNGVLSPSLVRSAKITLEERGANRGSHPETLRRTLAPSVFSDLGKHHIALAIGRFDPQAPREEQPAALADILFTPPLEYFGNAAHSGFLGLEGGDSLQPAWAMPVDQRTWTLRLHETLGRSGSALIHLNEGFSATPVDLSGKPLSKPTNTIAFRPYQIVSVKIERTENT